MDSGPPAFERAGHQLLELVERMQLQLGTEQSLLVPCRYKPADEHVKCDQQQNQLTLHAGPQPRHTLPAYFCSNFVNSVGKAFNGTPAMCSTANRDSHGPHGIK